MMPLVDLSCPVVTEAADATPVAGIKTLTQNQKKKRRHKLAKLGARQQVKGRSLAVSRQSRITRPWW